MLVSSFFFFFLSFWLLLLLLLLLFGLYKYIKGDTGECGACQRDSCHQRRNCHCLYCLSVSQALIYIIQDIIDRPIRQAPILFLPLLLYVYIFIFLILLFSLGDFLCFVLFFLFSFLSYTSTIFVPLLESMLPDVFECRPVDPSIAF